MFRLSLILVGLVIGLSASASSQSIKILGKDGKPVEGAYVTVIGGDEQAANKPFYLDQRNVAFDPLVLAVPVNAEVIFRNSDSVSHHIFSFSKAVPDGLEVVVKPGSETSAVVFPNAGAVRLGCNIHDQMTAFIYVAPSAVFAKTGADGTADLALPNGAVEVEVWTEGMGSKPERHNINIASSTVAEITVSAGGSAKKSSRRSSRRRRY